MDYKKVYNQIIERGKNRILEGYKERHHIVPKCLDGGNDSENLVDLTAREHYICHWLLARIHPESPKIGTAFWFMSYQKSKGQERYYKVSSRTYAEAMSCIKFSEEHKRNMGKWRKGRKTIVHPITNAMKYVPAEDLPSWVEKGWENTNYGKGKHKNLSEEGRERLAESRRREQKGKTGLDAQASKGPYTVIYEDGTHVTKGSYPELVKATGIGYSTLWWKSVNNPGKFSKGFAVIKGN